MNGEELRRPLGAVHSQNWLGTPGKTLDGTEVLLVDDLETVLEDIPSQRDLLRILESLCVGGGAAILAANLPATRLVHLVPGLRARLGWGLTAILTPPRPKARSAVLWQWAGSRRLLSLA
jgi:chromosomal replication initiation ATPase DnaA